MPDALRKASTVFSRAAAAIGDDEHTILLTLAVVIGAAGGAAVILFYKTIDLVQRIVLRGAVHAPLPALLLIHESRQTEFPVMSADGELTGMLTREAVREALETGDPLARLVVAADLIRPYADRVTPDDSLLAALRTFGIRDVDYLPVVDATGALLGIVSRQDLLATYERELTTEAR